MRVNCANGGVEHSEHATLLETLIVVLIWTVNTVATVISWLTPRWFKWCPTSIEKLQEAECRMLYHFKGKYELRDVTIDNCTAGSAPHSIRTLSIKGTSTSATPIILLHGFGSGLAMWSLNLEELCGGKRSIYAIDMLGFGRSSRPRFSSEALEAEQEFVRSVEKWRQVMGIEKAIMLGHALGGYIAASYALSYPERVAHLILVDPWGLPERSPHTERHLDIPGWAKMAVNLLHPFNPLGILRAAGPLGPQLVAKFRPDLRKKFDHVIKDKSVVPNYVYHINAQSPSGEAAFRGMMNSLGWARHPMLRRIAQLRPNISITFVYGSRSWVDKQPGVRVKHMRPHSVTEVQVVEGAGHHVYADKANEFNELVNQVAVKVDLEEGSLLE